MCAAVYVEVKGQLQSHFLTSTSLSQGLSGCLIQCETSPHYLAQELLGAHPVPVSHAKVRNAGIADASLYN